jgi:PAS domain S-box-containing protein
VASSRLYELWRAVVSAIRDATARDAMDAALREGEDRLSLAVEAAGLGLFYAVPYGPMYWSPRCREIFGVGDAPIPDFEAFLQLVHPADREKVRQAAARWLAPGGDGRYQDQYRCLRPDGGVRWVAASGIVRWGHAAHVPVQLVGTIFDITDQKLAQEQLMLTDRLASVGMLAAGVAHEINNPLSYLMGALDFLDEQARSAGVLGEVPDATRALAEAREGAQRVRQVVRDLRALSGTREERRARVALPPIVDSAIRMAASETQPRARVVREFGEAPAVVADEARLGQVVLNLLVNAAHAIPEGAAEANEIRIVIGTDASGRALLEVRDTGSGIAPEAAARIFDPFFSTKPRGVGTGLGLAICRSIVVALGGEISAEPRAGGGTTLRVVLPPAPAEAPGPVPAGVGRRGRVLVVDDDPGVGLAIQSLLAREHDVVLRTRAGDALDAVARGERFDAILCDVAMPGMTAQALHEALSLAAPDQARRMVLLTEGTPTAGASEPPPPGLPRVGKPVEVEALREVLQGLLGRGAAP